ncbi:hypothetical protein LEP1GSC151_4893 [Leptospira interrogans serovar Grippotyphosa str. LT2186]|uniref:Uncharacterized protein n=4 Tax=Leptospira TaxID=171 RepID=M3I3Z3_LEPIR|nr:hypothetical protein LEP1GSC104_3991 [Leptospira interrogans str. UI 12621]EKP05644.1 hypothetical protein LEP1GSC018_3925 [Leptospira kirschneri str. 2008720114]EKR47073.1 hypothetical protein LEP1GSC097_4619 [Leptospira interrogans serovar Grippotyphosa str. UI 08368]EMF71838.1 hypothetical protein LEP1GSC148_3564 [Leptospira interrogans serovar Canicola str. LT1962]EMG10607.1 hypothetical protein LEP1GSC151_4893 [Leptospira interrogans serovar Grippotyphosa str. LT2186]EMJ55825.1 hypothe
MVPGPVDDSIVTIGVGIYQIYRYFKISSSSKIHDPTNLLKSKIGNPYVINPY